MEGCVEIKPNHARSLQRAHLRCLRVFELVQLRERQVFLPFSSFQLQSVASREQPEASSEEPKAVPV
jgi:hypothetical protein